MNKHLIAIALFFAPAAWAETNDIIPYYDYDVSLVRLIAQPDQYHGRAIRVAGYLHCRFESYALYLSKEDADYLRSKNAIWVTFSDEFRRSWSSAEKPGRYNPEDFDCKNVVLEGCFNKDEHGHLGATSGGIIDVTRVVEQPRLYDGPMKLDGNETRPPGPGCSPQCLEPPTRSIQ